MTFALEKARGAKLNSAEEFSRRARPGVEGYMARDLINIAVQKKLGDAAKRKN